MYLACSNNVLGSGSVVMRGSNICPGEGQTSSQRQTNDQYSDREMLGSFGNREGPCPQPGGGEGDRSPELS